MAPGVQNGTSARHSDNFPLFQGNPYSSQKIGQAYSLRTDERTAARATKTSVRAEHSMMTQRLRKSSMYRFHDSVRHDRKYLIVALAAALILAAILASLGLTVFPTFPK